MGDFNNPLYAKEKMGGLKDLSKSIYDLEGFLIRNDLIDIDLKGPSFTWSNNGLGTNLIQLRIDRALILASWNILLHTCLKEDPRSILDNSMLVFSWMKFQAY